MKRPLVSNAVAASMVRARLANMLVCAFGRIDRNRTTWFGGSWRNRFLNAYSQSFSNCFICSDPDERTAKDALRGWGYK